MYVLYTYPNVRCMNPSLEVLYKGVYIFDCYDPCNLIVLNLPVPKTTNAHPSNESATTGNLNPTSALTQYSTSTPLQSATQKCMSATVLYTHTHVGHS